MNPYIPILVLLAIAPVFAGAFIVLSRFVGPRNPTAEKVSTYECGIEPEGNARGRYSVHFYLVAIEFIIFDVEAALLYPWAVTYRDQIKAEGFGPLGMVIVFIAILFLGLAYTAGRGVLDWSKNETRKKMLAHYESEELKEAA